MGELDEHGPRLMINDQLDTIMSQAAALRADDVRSRKAAVALLAEHVRTLVQWEELAEKSER